MRIKPLSQLSVVEVTRLLVSLELFDFFKNLEENELDGPTLVNCLLEAEVEELGIRKPNAKILYEEIIKFKSTGVPLTLISVTVPETINSYNVETISSELTETINSYNVETISSELTYYYEVEIISHLAEIRKMFDYGGQTVFNVSAMFIYNIHSICSPFC